MTRTVFIFHLDDDEKRVAYYCNGCNIEEDETIYAEPIGKPVEALKARLGSAHMKIEWEGPVADIGLRHLDSFNFLFVVRERAGMVTKIDELNLFVDPDYEKIMA